MRSCILADPIAAEDAVHEFTSLTTRRLAAVRTPDAYLRRAVRNACYDIERRRRVRGTETSDLALLEAIETTFEAPECLGHRIHFDCARVQRYFGRTLARHIRAGLSETEGGRRRADGRRTNRGISRRAGRGRGAGHSR